MKSVGGKMKMVLLLCSFPAEFMESLEEHYGKYRHTEAALGLHNMTDETLRPGTKRYKVNQITCWSDILTVTPEAVQRNVTPRSRDICAVNVGRKRSRPDINTSYTLELASHRFRRLWSG